MAEKIVVGTSILIDIFEQGSKELLLKLAGYEAFVPYAALYEYLWGYLYISRDPTREKELIERFFRVVYPDQGILLKARAGRLAREAGAHHPAGRHSDRCYRPLALPPLLSKDIKHRERLKDFGLKLLTASIEARSAGQAVDLSQLPAGGAAR